VDASGKFKKPTAEINDEDIIVSLGSLNGNQGHDMRKGTKKGNDGDYHQIDTDTTDSI
jgi:hypothetical protein